MNPLNTKIQRRAKDTLTAIELNQGDILEFELVSREVVRFELISTSARVVRTTLKELKVPQWGGRTDISFDCVLSINGTEHHLTRIVPSQQSFYEPWEIDGVRIWLDGVDDIFDYILESHGECRPHKHARFALQDASLRICPERLYPWFPLPSGGLNIKDCYKGENCWLGPFGGFKAHNGLDVNMKNGTPLYAPFHLDDQYLFNGIAMGHDNNRWYGIRHWENGAQWYIQVDHITQCIVTEHTPISRGLQVATGAGTKVGQFEHSHFMFKITDYGETILLDPWILFWQMYRDQADNTPEC